MDREAPVAGHAIEEIYCRAAEQADPSARAAYVAEACGTNSELRREVERLLEARAERGRFLESSGPGPTIERQARELVEGPGTTVGPYKLMEQIGEGGMGIVYVAEQAAPLRRKVALKVIKPGMDSKQVIARFEAERQALAMMDHANIARVFDGGTTASGRPYFVMELVRGLPITAYCDEGKLSIHERLDLFVLVCRAVQHAHQKGIIHRDLKPSNVLVTLHDGVPVPKVIDFGIAKATGQSLTDKTVYTAFAQMVGTPLYMSPEQLELSGLDIDTRSDIYSLGVLLYELLTGTTPFDSETLRRAAFDEMRRMIREEEPPRPSTRLSTLGETLTTTSAKRSSDPRRLDRAVRGELDWIAMKALEKDRRRRYETANDFAADVIRYLADQPVEACPPSTGYRFRKFARRNKVALTTGALVIAAMSIGLAVSTWQAARADAGERQARDNLKKAREAVDQMLVRVADRLADVPHMEKVRHELLADSLKFYEGFLREQGTDPEVRFETGLAYYQYGKMQVLLGKERDAEKAFLQAMRIFGELAREIPGHRDYRFNLAQSHNEIGKLASDRGRLPEAEQAYRAALEICKRLEADFPDGDYRTWVAARLYNLGLLLDQSGRLLEAEATLRESLAIRLRPPQYANVLWECHIALAHVLHGAGRMAEAEQHGREAMEIQQTLVARSPNSTLEIVHLGSTHQMLGLILQKSGRPADAEREYRNCLALHEKLATDFPNVPRYRFQLAGGHLNLGTLLSRTDRLTDSERECRKCLSISETLIADFPESPSYQWIVAASLGNLGDLLLQANRLPEAETSYRRALKISEKLAAEQPDELSHREGVRLHIGGLGQVLMETGRLDEAERAIRRSLAIAQTLVAEFPGVKTHREALALAHGNLGIIQYRRGDWKAAIGLLEKWLELVGEHEVDGDPHFFLAMTRWRLGDTKNARITYDHAARWMDKNDPFNQRLGRSRAEAKALLDVVDEPKPEKPLLPP